MGIELPSGMADLVRPQSLQATKDILAQTDPCKQARTIAQLVDVKLDQLQRPEYQLLR